jgi:hypothetical protein
MHLLPVRAGIREVGSHLEMYWCLYVESPSWCTRREIAVVHEIPCFSASKSTRAQCAATLASARAVRGAGMFLVIL